MSVCVRAHVRVWLPARVCVGGGGALVCRVAASRRFKERGSSVLLPRFLEFVHAVNVLCGCGFSVLGNASGHRCVRV